VPAIFAMIAVRVLGLLVALGVAGLGAVMAGRRLRLLLGGRLVDGSIAGIAATRSGGAFVYELRVAPDDDPGTTYLVRSYREFEPDTRVRIRVHSADPRHGWLDEWSHLGYELGVGLALILGGTLGGMAVLLR
jgi:hypothetical protein